MRFPQISLGLAVLCATTLAAQQPAKKAAGPAGTKKDAMSWGPAPAAFPAGAKMAVVSGDPSKAENFTVQLSFPNGYKIPPHFHPTDENVEVKSGTFVVGMGDTFDAAQMKPMKAGDKGTVPANGHHYASAKGATVVQVTAMGPFAMTYVNPSDDPRQKGKM